MVLLIVLSALCCLHDLVYTRSTGNQKSAKITTNHNSVKCAYMLVFNVLLFLF